MSHFICSIVTDASGAPAAYALTEQAPARGDDLPTYHVRALGRFADSDPVETIRDLLADEEQYAGRTTLVATGGQPGADRFADAGLSAVAVSLGERADDDVLRASEQTLVDTFAAVYRFGTVEMPGTQEEASAVVAALYAAMSDDAGAEDASEEMEALAEEEATGVAAEPVPADGPKPDTAGLSGSSAALSTAKIGGDESDRNATVDEAATGPDAKRGRVDDRNDGAADLGEPRDLALATALGIWYGERRADDLPTTDQADETARVARVRARRRAAARAKQNR